MFEVVLYQPEIPPNTGNIIRLCAGTGATLHLIEPLGFHLEDKSLRRAGLDYHEFATVRRHASLAAFREALPERRIFALTKFATTSLYSANFESGDVFLFGSESRGLPPDIATRIPLYQNLRIPMRREIRSLNLANAASIVVYEALRQCIGGLGTLTLAEHPSTRS